MIRIIIRVSVIEMKKMIKINKIEKKMIKKIEKKIIKMKKIEMEMEMTKKINKIKMKMIKIDMKIDMIEMNMINKKLNVLVF